MQFSELIKSLRLKNNLSYKDVERNSKGTISASYVHQLENGVIRPDSLSITKLRALAKGLNANEKVIFDAARGYTPNEDEQLSDLMYEAFGGEKVDIEVLRKAIELIKTMEKK